MASFLYKLDLVDFNYFEAINLRGGKDLFGNLDIRFDLVPKDFLGTDTSWSTS